MALVAHLVYEPRVIRAYVAHHALRWPRQLDRAERVLDRYEA